MVQMASPQKRLPSGVWYFRRRVPDDLTDIFGKEVNVSLRTKDGATAKRRFIEESVRFDDRVERARRERSLPFDTLTVYRAEALAGEWFKGALEADAVHRMETDGAGLIDTAADVTAHHVTLEEIERINTLPTQRRRAALLAFVADHVRETTALHTLRLEPESVSHLRLAEAIFSAALRVEQVREARTQNDKRRAHALQSDFAADFPSLPRENVAPQERTHDARRGFETPPLTEVTAAYLAKKNLPARTRAETDKSIRRFIEVHGDVASSDVTKAMVREWVALLEQLPKRQTGRQKKMKIRELAADCASLPPGKCLEVKTVNKDISTFGTVLNFASKNWTFPGIWRNPTEGMKVERPREARRKQRASFTDEDFKAIFSTPIYTRGERPRGGGGEAAKWIPLLAAYTGARLEEIGQLQVDDVALVTDVWCIDINERDGKSAKTKSSIRKVPLHSDLISHFGFLSYVDQRRKVGSKARLFPELTEDKTGVLTGSWGKFFGRTLRGSVAKGGCGIEDRSKVFHSFRHTFKTRARAAGVPENIHDAMTGHSRSGVGSTYGEREPVHMLADWLEKLDFSVISMTACGYINGGNMPITRSRLFGKKIR